MGRTRQCKSKMWEIDGGREKEIKIRVKGMLLFGPLGIGKTLIAHQIEMMLNGHEPKIVNVPEVPSKYVGETKKNGRDLFADAKNDQRTRQDSLLIHN